MRSRCLPGPGPTAAAAATKGEGGPGRVQLDAAVLEEECAGMDSHWNASSGYLCLNKGLASPQAGGPAFLGAAARWTRLQLSLNPFLSNFFFTNYKRYTQ